MKKLLINEKIDCENLLKSEISKSAKIKELFNAGKSTKEIAILLNIRYNFAYNVISNYININEIEIEKSNENSKKIEIIKLFENGKTNIEISKILKINYNYVYKVIKSNYKK